MEIDTRTYKDFLSNDEIDEIRQLFADPSVHYLLDNKHKADQLYSNYLYLTKESDLKRLSQIVDTKVYSLFHPDLHIGPWHVLDAYVPYTIHTDAYSDLDPSTHINNEHDYAWTFIIPLDDYNSTTIIFDQISPTIKNTKSWMEKLNPPFLDEISEEFIEKYLSHESPDLIRRLSLHDTFPWTRGAINATSRKRFHCSSNFVKDGLKNKKALIAWSTIPKDLLR